MTGGQDNDGQFYYSAHTFKDGSWQSVPTLPKSLYNHCQVNINGNVIIAGGRNGQDALVNTWALEGGQWAEVGSMTEGRYLHACAAFKGKMFSIGGKSSGGTSLSSVEVYDPMTRTWARGPDLPEGIEAGQAVTFQDTLFFMVGDMTGGKNKKILSLTSEAGGWEEVPGISLEEQFRGVFPAQIVGSHLLNCQ